MSPAAFLLIALVVGLLGSLFLVVRTRQSQRPDAAMDDFRREMQALAPTPTPPPDAVPIVESAPPRLPFRPTSSRPHGGGRDDTHRPDRRNHHDDPRSGAGSDLR